jgi:hypothetical protein
LVILAPLLYAALSVSAYLTQAVPYEGAKPGAAIAVQRFDDIQNFTPHLHAPATDGCFYSDVAF